MPYCLWSRLRSRRQTTSNMRGSFDDLGRLLRAVRPARVRLDGDEYEVPAQHKRWSALEAIIQRQQPEQVELCDADGNVLALVAEPEEPSQALAVPPLEQLTQHGALQHWAALTVAQSEAWKRLFEERAQFTQESLVQQRELFTAVTEAWKSLARANEEALRTSERRSKALADLVARDAERYDLAPSDDDEAEQNELLTNLAQIAQVAPHLMPLFTQIKGTQ